MEQQSNHGDTADFYVSPVSADLDAYQPRGDLDRPFGVSAKRCMSTDEPVNLSIVLREVRAVGITAAF